MRDNDLIALLKSGAQPVIRLRPGFQDLEEPNGGMIARVIGFRPAANMDDGVLETTWDFHEFYDHNVQVAEPAFFDENHEPRLKWQETRYYKNGQLVYYLSPSDEELEIDLLDDSGLLSEYQASKSPLSYTAWLERELKDLRERVRETSAPQMQGLTLEQEMEFRIAFDAYRDGLYIPKSGH